MIGLFIFSQFLINAWETTIYEDRVIFSHQSQISKDCTDKKQRRYQIIS